MTTKNLFYILAAYCQGTFSRLKILFGQLLPRVPRAEVTRLVARHRAGRVAKGLTCWTHFVATMFCQLPRLLPERVVRRPDLLPKQNGSLGPEAGD